MRERHPAVPPGLRPSPPIRRRAARRRLPTGRHRQVRLLRGMLSEGDQHATRSASGDSVDRRARQATSTGIVPVVDAGGGRTHHGDRARPALRVRIAATELDKPGSDRAAVRETWRDLDSQLVSLRSSSAASVIRRVIGSSTNRAISLDDA